MAAPPRGSRPFSPVYDYFVDATGQTCKVLRTPQLPQTKTEYRCSPRTGKLFTVQVPVTATTTPPVSKYLEWRCNPVTGERHQVEVTSDQHTPHSPTYPHAAAGSMGQVGPSQQYIPPQQLPQLGPGHQTGRLQPQAQQELPCGHAQRHPVGATADGTFNQQLQDKVKGIVRLVESGVTNKPAKTMDFAKKCSAKWAKKTTLENVNLPLFTFGAIGELESSLSGRTEPLAEGELLAKLRHIKNYLEVCCLNSEQTDFKGYGWTIAKDYALKVEGEVDQNITTWVEMSGGVQTSQLVLAQMDFPRPNSFQKKAATGVGETKGTITKDRCRTYNTCKTDDKCDYEVSHPDKKCLLKHECTWCKTNLRQSFKHQEWNCKKKN